MPASKISFCMYASPMKLSEFQFKDTLNWVQKAESFTNFCLYVAYAFLQKHKNRFSQFMEWSTTNVIG